MSNRFLPQIRTIFLLSIILFFTTTSWGQKQHPDEFWDHVRFGGGIGLSFGDGFFSGTLAPSAIYQFNQQFATGVALSGTYNSLRNNYNSTIVGASVLGLYNPIKEIQLSVEFEELYVTRDYKRDLYRARESYWYPGLFVGIGISAANVTIGIRYDVLYDNKRSIYANAYAPFVRVYF